MSTVRVRFAPSPTGHLHIGGARTALFNWLFARNAGGEYLLRIEDTDVERSKDEYVVSIMDSLRWLGLEWDQEPLYQSKRRDIHREIALDLMGRGKAYPCFCEKERPETDGSTEDSGKTYLYPRTCLVLSKEERSSRLEAGEPYALRFLVPEGETQFVDLVYGANIVEHSNIDDFVLLRRDGSPTYQLAVVADDIFMSITHVIRGDGHLPNTPKQILLYEALGATPPKFVHLPLILGSDKKPLAKRHGATSIISYRDAGFLPEAVDNFLALLGWSPGDDTEVLSSSELTHRFSFERVSRKAAVFDIQKLEWLNGKYISQTPGEDLFVEVTEDWIQAGLITERNLEEHRGHLLEIIDLLKSRVRLITDFVDAARPFFDDNFPYEDAAVAKRWKDPELVIGVLQNVQEAIRGIGDFTNREIEDAVRAVAGRMGLSNSKVFHPVRVALTGRMAGPGLFDMMKLIGRDGCLDRFDRAIAYLESKAAQEDDPQL